MSKATQARETLPVSRRAIRTRLRGATELHQKNLHDEIDRLEMLVAKLDSWTDPGSTDFVSKARENIKKKRTALHLIGAFGDD